MIQKHILVIRLSAMGDVAMSVPVLLALNKEQPDLKITVLTRAFFAPMFLQLPNVTVFEAEVKGKHKGVLGLYKLFKELQELHITEVADLHNVLRSSVLRIFFKLSNTPFVQINKGRKEKKALTVLKEKNITPLTTTHERYADVFRKLGYSINLRADNVLKREKLTDRMLEYIGSTPKKWIGIAPFAAFDGKMYPLSFMERVLQELNTKEDYTVLLFGGGKKESIQLQKWAKLYPNCKSVAGEFSFKEELIIIANLDCMVAMDSGNAHLAAMYGVPTITLWGVTHPYAGFAPFWQDAENCLLADRNQYPFIPTSVFGKTVPEGYKNVMQTIDPITVTSKIYELL